ncbi:glycosyltransferase family 4 protein [Nostocaceae cyanobacterium CENA369]|uniref:Glycosyltransferase family 4 protein n=1 Tax=Dendronalium phyllosphericum CENA369 TaxID=1725256 RepID=A0A8J7LFS8_9NOST|nr:glycosyltransferase family 4 protein [Dendronalium phyllosphericum]MBH8576322.1 glycosyltransferase family 4 protein [Dendronalium phyllosphericum CENA369]
MNILHINQYDILDGSAIAAHRLHQGLLNQGINSRLFVGRATTRDDRIAVIPDKFPIATKLNHLLWHLGLNYLTILNTFDIPKHKFYQEADILNFHDILGGYFNYLALPHLTTDKPAVMTLHQMWSFTGHCSFSYECERWKIGCGKCPYPDEYPPIGIDNTHLEWKLKNWIYNRSSLTIVAPSSWLAEQARQSMLNRFPIHHIPNGIDTEAYQPIDSEQCRSLLGIQPGKKVLMFGAIDLNYTRKGGDLLLKAIQSLPESLKAETVLLIIGRGGEAISKVVDIPTVNLGYVSSDRIKSIAFSAADLFIFPTRADNLPLVLQESMACATPMVSFKVGGVPDMVRPGITGYLAEPDNVQDLCNGIIQLLEDEKLKESMSQNCREIALAEYSLELQVKSYLKLYINILQN